MRDLEYQLTRLHRERGKGSFGTRRDRLYMLTLAAKQLEEGGGFRGLQYRGLRSKHVDYLVQRWRQEGIAWSTMKNRLAALRWWAREIGRPGVVPSNAKLRLGEPAPYRDRTRVVDPEKLAKVGDARVRMSLRLQAEFGLRREEAIKFRPSYADRGDRVVLKRSWTKGGRPRSIPIRTESQRRVLDAARQLAGRGGMIPADRNYARQRDVYCGECRAVGFDHMHGLRHAYAQGRYEELTGWPCPAQGGPSRAELNGDRLKADTEARMTISAELGHGRMDVVAKYIGK